MAMKYTEEQLNSIDKSILVQLFLAMQEESEKQTRRLEEMDTKLGGLCADLLHGSGRKDSLLQ